MKIGMSQSNYLPWKGYFDLIKRSDLFIFYDDVQYTRHDWRNRNKIKTRDGLKWLTVPVGQSRSRKIYDVEIKDELWQKKHWETIKQNYRKAPYFNEYAAFFEYIYCGLKWKYLSELNQYLIREICGMLDIRTGFGDSRDYGINGVKEERVIEILKKVGCTTYNFGPLGKNYMTDADFEKHGMDVHWMEYRYSEYPQLYMPFEGNVSIIDLLFNMGDKAKHYL